MLRNLKKRTEGFTIIEVLIVLAIAGLILLIVFLAVPALQRNSRNSGRKSDISRIGGAVIEYMNNNNGNKPQDANKQTVLDSAGTLGQYESDGISIRAFTNPAGSPAVTDKDTIVIVTGAKCDTGGAVAKGGSRQIAIQWASETTGTGTSGCTEF